MHAQPQTSLTLVPRPPIAALPDAAALDHAPKFGDDVLFIGADAQTPPQPEDAAPAAPLVILGRDDRGRPHASRFLAEDAGRVGNAAGLMGMAVLAIEGAALADLTAGLPQGRLFASGKAFVPFCAENLFNRLVAYLPIAQRTAATPVHQSAGKTAAEPPAAQGGAADGLVIKPGTLPSDWDKIKLNSVVLATLDPADGWWPAVVTELKPDGLYVLKWAEWSDGDPFLRRAEQLALLHPGYPGK